jgi:hypothetical protein
MAADGQTTAKTDGDRPAQQDEQKRVVGHARA